MGAGMGRFCYYFLSEWQRTNPRIDIRYVVTDCAAKNVHYCLNHPQMKTFIEKGMLDGAVLSSHTMVGGKVAIELIVEKRTLGKGSLKNAPILIANYVFCVLEQDAFRVDDHGILQEALIDDMHELEFEYRIAEPTGYYPQSMPKEFNRMLGWYRDTMAENAPGSSFLLPIGALCCVEAIAALGPQRMLVLCSDKARKRILKNWLILTAIPLQRGEM